MPTILYRQPKKTRLKETSPIFAFPAHLRVPMASPRSLIRKVAASEAPLATIRRRATQGPAGPLSISLNHSPLGSRVLSLLSRRALLRTHAVHCLTQYRAFELPCWFYIAIPSTSLRAPHPLAQTHPHPHLRHLIPQLMPQRRQRRAGARLAASSRSWHLAASPMCPPRSSPRPVRAPIIAHTFPSPASTHSHTCTSTQCDIP